MASLPPGPRSRWWTTFQVMTGGAEVIERLRDAYGDPFLIRSMNGDLVTTGRPQARASSPTSPKLS